MNIFWREMKANRQSLIIWCVAVLAMVASGMSKYSAASVSGQSMNELIAQMPKSIQTILGTGTFDLAKASGFYGVLFLYLVVMATIHAAMLGATIIAKEERDKTAEFLFAKPASRAGIVTAKLAAALVNLVLFNLVTLVSSLVVVGHFSKGEQVNAAIFRLMLGMFILQITYLVLGTSIAAISKKPKTAVSVATGILLITFFLSMLIDLSSKVNFLQYLTPFKYYEAKSLMYSGGFQAIFLVLSALTVAVLLGVTYTFYNRKDMNI
ncbi:MAG: ABC transporter permease subunit [Peptococcaceae bacterium]|nr:ABC transporter permease subunit [Peptococcaceae bacterium]